jgi:hypothetical protein
MPGRRATPDGGGISLEIRGVSRGIRERPVDAHAGERPHTEVRAGVKRSGKISPGTAGAPFRVRKDLKRGNS